MKPQCVGGKHAPEWCPTTQPRGSLHIFTTTRFYILPTIKVLLSLTVLCCVVVVVVVIVSNGFGTKDTVVVVVGKLFSRLCLLYL